MIESIDGKGVNRANAICDECGRKEVVTCDYFRSSGGDWSPNEGQVKKKITAHGWSNVKGKLRCPKCEANRKVVNMQDVKSQRTPEPTEPTKKQRIEIFTLLAEVYDLDAQRYTGGETDDTVAEVLKVRPGWVAQIREAEFGPAGNEDMDLLRADIEAAIKGAEAEIKAAGDYAARLGTQRDKLVEMGERLERITKAVGARVIKRAGV